jgi:tRNA threonylcarbamoyladenosine biosynthesis protein TsaE
MPYLNRSKYWWIVTEKRNSGMFKFYITTHSVEETKKLGEKLGELLNVGTVIALIGDLGSGKTSFVQGLAGGLDVPDVYYITSPSYTLINEYPGRHPLFHVDLYRIENPVDFEDIGLYEILDDKGIVAIEWADRIQKELLHDHLIVDFEIIDDKTRKICLSAHGHECVNLLKELENF